MRLQTAITLSLLFLLLIAGCSSSGKNPVGMSPLDQSLTSNLSPERTSANAPILWGMWDIAIDTSTGNVEIVPTRGIQYTVNVTNFLQPPAGKTTNLGIKINDVSEWLTLGHLPVEVTLTHPFNGFPQYTGADVRGVFITTGSKIAQHDGDISFTDQGIDDPYLANADGYTRWMNPVEFVEDGTILTFKKGALGIGTGFNATLNPYKYFTNGLSANGDLYSFFSNPANLAKRGQFLSGTSCTRLYDLYFVLQSGSPVLHYQYAVLASWNQPTDLDPGDIPGSFPPDANTAESFLINVVDNSDLYYTNTEAGGDIELDIEIFDWSPFLGTSSSVLDEIENIYIESPQGILPVSFATFDNPTLAATAQPGTTAASSIVSIEITGCTPTGINDQQVLIAIEHSGGANYANDPIGTNYSSAPLTAYFMVELNVGSVIPQGDAPVVTAITPPYGIAGTHIYDIEVTGSNFTGVNQVRLIGISDEVAAPVIDVVSDSLIICELNLAGLSLGLYDVAADDPVDGTGTLEDGYEVVDFKTGIHNSFTMYSTTQEHDPLFVAGLLTSGPKAANVITQNGAFTWATVEPGVPPSNGTPVNFFANKINLDPIVNDWSWGMDNDPVNKVYAYTGFDDDFYENNWPYNQYDYIKICKESDGSYVGAVDTDCGYAVAQVDFDEYGNLWAVCSDVEVGSWPNFTYSVQRWDYDPNEPAPHYKKVGDWPITEFGGDSKVISDIVVLQRYRRMYISHSNGFSPWGVRVQEYDISGTNPVSKGSQLYTADYFYGTDSYQEVHQRFVDMDVDRTDSIYAGSRIMVMFMGGTNLSEPAAYRTLELRKIGVGLTLQNSASLQFDVNFTTDCFGSGNFDSSVWLSNYVLDDVHGGRVVATYDNFCVPGNGYVGVAPAPSGW